MKHIEIKSNNFKLKTPSSNAMTQIYQLFKSIVNATKSWFEGHERSLTVYFMVALPFNGTWEPRWVVSILNNRREMRKITSLCWLGRASLRNIQHPTKRFDRLVRFYTFSCLFPLFFFCLLFVIRFVILLKKYVYSLYTIWYNAKMMESSKK